MKKRRRNLGAKFTSTISIALVLFVLGLLIVGGLTAARLSEVLREQFKITITMSDQAEDGFAPRLATQLQHQPSTASAIYISADSAQAVVAQLLGESPDDFLGYNPLLPSVELQLKSEYAVADSIERIVASIQEMGGVSIESIDYNEAFIDNINSNIRHATYGLAVLAAVLLLISISLINNTVRLSLHSERFLINTMRLVGATGWFIRKPFVRTHVVCGIIAAIVALGALAGLLLWAAYRVQELRSFVEDDLMRPLPLALLVGSVLLLGIFIPACAAWRATGRYLHRSADELYLM